MKKSAPNDALDPRRPTRYAPAVDRRVVRFNNDLQEPVLRKVMLRKKERRTSRVACSGEAVLASTYFGPYLDGTPMNRVRFSLYSPEALMVNVLCDRWHLYVLIYVYISLIEYNVGGGILKIS